MAQDKPFIKLLRSPNSGYVYDVNCNKIVSVSDEAYEYLNHFDLKCINSSDVMREIDSLKAFGFLQPNRIRKIKHPMLDDLDVILKRRVKMITLQLTQACNLRCDYCIYSSNKNHRQRSHSNKKMSLENVKKD